MKANSGDVRLYLVLAAVLLLAINDHYWKYEHPGAVTGKLSDIFGLFAFPVFLSFFLPDKKYLPSLIAALVFIWWKSPFSGFFIEFFNTYGPLQMARTIDYTDLWCLLVLPVSFFFSDGISFRFHPRLNGMLIMGCWIVFCATTIKPIRSLTIHKSYKVNQSADSILQTWILRSDTTQAVITSDTLNNPDHKQVKIQKLRLQPDLQDTTRQVSVVSYVATVYMENNRSNNRRETIILLEMLDCYLCGISKGEAKEWFRRDFIKPLEK